MNRKEWRELTGGGGFSIRRFEGVAGISSWGSVLYEASPGIQIFRESQQGGVEAFTTLTPWHEKQLKE